MATNYAHLEEYFGGNQQQTKFSTFMSSGERITYGNCLVTCIANMMSLPIDEIPNLYTFYGAKTEHLWMQVFNMWLNEVWIRNGALHQDDKLEIRKFSPAELKTDAIEDSIFIEVIARGLSMRGKPHCILIKPNLVRLKLDSEGLYSGPLKDGHDPHPSKEGLSEVHYFYVICLVKK